MSFAVALRRAPQRRRLESGSRLRLSGCGGGERPESGRRGGKGNPGGSKLDAHEGCLGLVERQRDTTLAEMRVRLVEERGVTAGVGTL